MAIATQRVLIVKTSSLGDIMHGLQVAQTLKENDPGIEISWVARRRYEGMVRASSAVDRTFAFYRSGGVSAFWGLCRQLRRERFDAILDMQGLARSGLMTFFARAIRKIGRSDAREGATLFYRELAPLPRKPERLHPVEILLEFCRVFGFPPELKGTVRFDSSSSSDWPVGESEIAGTPRIVLAPEGRRPGLSWEGFEALATSILGKFPRARVLVITRGKTPWVNALGVKMGGRVQQMRPKDWLRIAIAIQESDVLVANDSDTLQIGAAVGVSTLGIFGPSDPNRTGAYPLSNPRNRALIAPDGRSEALSVDAVVGALSSAMERH